MDDPELTRRCARVLLVDADARLLLFHNLLDAGRPEQGGCWVTPGGGVDDEETLPAAAARELREETGLRVSSEDLGPVVAFTSGSASLSWLSGYFRDDYFFLRVDSHEVTVAAMEHFERSHHLGHRWWSVDDLPTASEPVYPFGLGELLPDLIAGRIPATPVRLPWHH